VPTISSSRRRISHIGAVVASLLLAVVIAACNGPTPVLTRLIEARHLASELRVAFLKSNEAANRAVLSVTDEDSSAAAREATQAADAAKQALSTLDPLLHSLGYQAEIDSLGRFRKGFEEYLQIEAEVLPLAVENTNLKAQRLSAGAAEAAADQLMAALGGAAGPSSPPDIALEVAGIRADVLEMQLVQARHITEADEATMTRMEQRVGVLAADARARLARLGVLLQGRSDQQLGAAASALDRFLAVDQEIVALSRRNTNVRSLALTLGRQRLVAAACEEELRTIEESLARHGSQASR
jgi:hypothetical protein